MLISRPNALTKPYNKKIGVTSDPTYGGSGKYGRIPIAVCILRNTLQSDPNEPATA
jgi:hypothetical protein